MIYQPKLRGFFVFRSFVCLFVCISVYAYSVLCLGKLREE